MSDPLELGPLVDHHCHGLILGELDRTAFESLLNEASAPAPSGTTFFDSMLGLAVRRWCAPVLDLEQHAPVEDYLARRRELGVEASRRLLAAAGIDTFLVDTGIGGDLVCTPDRLSELVGGRAYEVVRLEVLAEATLRSGTSPAEVPERLEAELRETTAVGAKSIAAYRVGLDLPAERPSPDAVRTALAQTEQRAGGRYRLADPVISAWLAWAAIEAGLPLQFHVGFGDADLDLHRADPLLLTPFLRATEERGLPVLLLHNYPFHRQASYLAQVFGHVYVDVGLAVHNTGALSRSVICETLEVVPFAKLLFSTDAYGLAELYHLGALLFRRGFADVLGHLVGRGELAADDASRIGRLVAHENARRIYRL